MKRCPSCQRQIDQHAARCPHCKTDQRRGDGGAKPAGEADSLLGVNTQGNPTINVGGVGVDLVDGSLGMHVGGGLVVDSPSAPDPTPSGSYDGGGGGDFGGGGSSGDW